MRLKNNNLFLWLASLLLAAGIASYSLLRNKPTFSGQVKNVFEKSLDFFNNPTNAGSSAGSRPKTKIDAKVYQNAEYEFEFTYPANFGEVSLKNYECPTGFIQHLPEGAGFMAVGSFGNNPDIDFGFVSADYKRCETTKDYFLFEILAFDVLENKLKLYSSDLDSSPVEVAIEQTIPTPTPNVTAYVIANTLEKDGQGHPAAILRRPNPKIGALVFRTHSQAGLKLLEDIIK